MVLVDTTIGNMTPIIYCYCLKSLQEILITSIFSVLSWLHATKSIPCFGPPDKLIPVPKTIPPGIPPVAIPHEIPGESVPYLGVTIEMAKGLQGLVAQYAIIGIDQHNNLLGAAHLLRPEDQVGRNGDILERMHNLHAVLDLHAAVLDMVVDVLEVAVAGEVVDVHHVVVGVVDGLHGLEVLAEQAAIAFVPVVHIVLGRDYADGNLLGGELLVQVELFVDQVVLGLYDVGGTGVSLQLHAQPVQGVFGLGEIFVKEWELLGEEILYLFTAVEGLHFKDRRRHVNGLVLLELQYLEGDGILQIKLHLFEIYFVGPDYGFVVFGGEDIEDVLGSLDFARLERPPVIGHLLDIDILLEIDQKLVLFSKTSVGSFLVKNSPLVNIAVAYNSDRIEQLKLQFVPVFLQTYAQSLALLLLGRCVEEGAMLLLAVWLSPLGKLEELWDLGALC